MVYLVRFRIGFSVQPILATVDPNHSFVKRNVIRIRISYWL